MQIPLQILEKHGGGECKLLEEKNKQLEEENHILKHENVDMVKP